MTRYAQRTLIQQGSVANWGKPATSTPTLAVDFMMVGGGGAGTGSTAASLGFGGGGGGGFVTGSKLVQVEQQQ
jgi:hypothetical protein